MLWARNEASCGRTLVLAAVLERHNVRDDLLPNKGECAQVGRNGGATHDENQGEQSAAAHALHAAKDDELQHRLRERTRQ